MRQFEIYLNPFEQTRRFAPFVVSMQSHLLEALPTVLVAPTYRAIERPAYSKVSVPIRFRDQDLIVSLAELAPMDARRLARALGDLAEYEDQLRRALERVFTGF